MSARKVIEAYHNARTTGKLVEAGSYLTDDLDFQGSIDRFNKADDFVKAFTQFQRMLTGVTLLKSFFSENGASLLYDCYTKSAAGVIKTAELFIVVNDKITEIRLVFNATELRRLISS